MDSNKIADQLGVIGGMTKFEREKKLLCIIIIMIFGIVHISIRLIQILVCSANIA